jgi:hypothetical protein
MTKVERKRACDSGGPDFILKTMMKTWAFPRTSILLCVGLVFLSATFKAKALAESDDEDDTEVTVSQSAKEDDDVPEVVVVNPFTEEQRLKGFFFHREYNRKFELYRQSGIGKVKKSREEWEKMMASTVPEYKRKRALEDAPLDESSAAYKKNLQKKYDFDLKLDEARKRYVKARDLAHQKRQSVKLSEEEEYDLFNKRERAKISERALYTGKIAKSTTGGGSSSSGTSGSYDSGGGSSGGYEPPQPPSIPPPPMPDFYEPDIPPPPPMPMDGGSFDEGIPPPIFDEPEF